MKMILIFGFVILLIAAPASRIAAESAVDPDTELKAASDYFTNLGITRFDCDVKIIFDPAEKYKLKDIEKWEIEKGTYVFIGHYHYEAGGKFNFKVFGEPIAQNDAEIGDMQSTIVVPLLPMPGSIMASETLKKRYTSSFKGEVDIEGNKCYRIRLDAIDLNKEFFRYMEYYIDAQSKVIRQADCNFDFGIWVGSGHGEFFYTMKKGKLLPNAGYGEIYLRSPYMKRMPLWGKWSGYKISSADESTETTENPEQEE